MATTSVARSRATQTVPLADLSITLPQPDPFRAPGKTITISGDQLAEVLRYVAMVSPSVEHFADREGATYELIGIAEMCRGLADADLDVDCNAVFTALSNRLSDLAHRLNARDPHTSAQKTVVTIGARKAGA